jgi:hypothetical protein
LSLPRLAIQVAIKYGKETEAFTDKLSKATEFGNEQGNHPILLTCVFVPFGRGAAIDQDTCCSLIDIHHELLHNVHHVEIHGLADIDIDRHLGHDLDDGEDLTNSICEILLDACDDNGLHPFHSVERTMKYDTVQSVFSKQNQDECNAILNDLATLLSAKCINGDTITAFRAQHAVHVYISTIEERKPQHHVKLIAYAKRIATRPATPVNLPNHLILHPSGSQTDA